MVQFAKEILPVNIEDEMRQSYLDYAMSVIVGRALPDVRDGLKPVHRRVLFAMHELNNDWNKPYKKSARIVGDVIGKYHPHGDSAVYDTIVRLAQPFSMRYPLVDGQGNFGSVDGDAPAAMRYTEIRMAKMAHDLLADIEKETVNFSPNYDGSELEPTVFPTRLPNLLINGASGIAVGMATNIPPHNLREVVNACLALIDMPELSIEALMQYIPAPDFPTAAIISGTSGIIDAYRTGRGRVIIRSKTHIESDEKSGREQIVVTELPYQVNKARLLERIAELVKEKKIEGISELRDESDKDGIRVVIEIKRNESAEVVLNNLFQQTSLQTVFGINMVALVDGQPRLLNLKQLLELFIRHRREVVTRRTLFELRKARERAHVLEGLAVALSNLDEMIELIKRAASPAEAKQQMLERWWDSQVVQKLLSQETQKEATAYRPQALAAEFGWHEQGYRLSEAQIQAILELRLNRLTGLEQNKILQEYNDIIQEIDRLLEILRNPEQLLTVIRQELNAVLTEYGDERRTQIIFDHQDFNPEDFITEEDVVVTLSKEGYIKAQPVSAYSTQRRGGKGKSATQMKEEDFIDKLFVANTHDTLLCFSNYGKVYWLKVYELPQASRAARGKPIVNLLPALEADERINVLLPIRTFDENHYVFMATAKGTVKKTALIDFSRPRSAGIIAVGLDEGDKLIGVDITNGNNDVLLFTQQGKAVHFHEEEVRSMGRTATGVRGVKLREDDEVMSLIVNRDNHPILVATVNGFGKCTEIDEFSIKGRSTQGVIAIKTSERNGLVVGAVQVTQQDDVMLITDKGTLVRIPINGISVVGRNTQGVTLINLSEGENLVGIDRVLEIGEEENSDDTGEDIGVDDENVEE